MSFQHGFQSKTEHPVLENHNMINSEEQLGSDPGQLTFSGLKEALSSDEEMEEPLAVLADAALALSGGGEAACSREEARGAEGNLQPAQLHFQFLMSKADQLHDCLVDGLDHVEGEALAAAVVSFLHACGPFFNHLESSARSSMSQLSTFPFDTYSGLLDLSQQLCDRLEQLVLTYASYNLLCLDESEANGVSHFCIGQSQLGHLRLTAFLYCRPTPYLARVHTGLYKRMRWNVDRLDERDEQQTTMGGERDEEAERISDTEYYFLCYEDIFSREPDASGEHVERMWSIGQWLQETPNPDTEDIYDWILCEVPQAGYHRLLLLGGEEPPSCIATDLLQQLLLSQQHQQHQQPSE